MNTAPDPFFTFSTSTESQLREQVRVALKRRSDLVAVAVRVLAERADLLANLESLALGGLLPLVVDAERRLIRVLELHVQHLDDEALAVIARVYDPHSSLASRVGIE